MSLELALEITGTAYAQLMAGQIAKLCLKIDNLSIEVLTLKKTVTSPLEEIEKFGKVRESTPDPEMQPPTIPTIPKDNFTIEPKRPSAV